MFRISTISVSLSLAVSVLSCRPGPGVLIRVPGVGNPGTRVPGYRYDTDTGFLSCESGRIGVPSHLKYCRTRPLVICRAHMGANGFEAKHFALVCYETARYQALMCAAALRSSLPAVRASHRSTLTHTRGIAAS
eukprot:2091485-Rhodomonas_salina.1